AELERYKEQVKVLKKGQNVDLKIKDNISDSCELFVEIDRLKQTLSEHLKEKESLMQADTLLKNDFKKEESRNIDREIALEKKIKQLDNIVYKRDQSAQTVHMLTKPHVLYDHTTKQALGFQNPFYLKKAQQLEPKLYDGNVIKSTSAIVIPDSEETLMLAEESHSKMLLKQQDPMVLEKKINTTPVDYVNSINSFDPSLTCRPTKVEVSKELPKVSMVNTSLKKLKHHLVGFDVVVKERTTATAITEGSWGFTHTKACFRDEIIPFVKALKDIFNTFDQYLIDELYEVQNVFHQMEQAVEQHLLESKTFEVKMNQVLNENERLLEQVINKVIMNIISQEKDTVIKKLKERIKSLSENMNEDKVKKDIEDIETINIKLDHKVSKLIAENEHLKQTYKQLYDPIKPTRIRSKEQCDALVSQVNQKYVEISDLNLTPDYLRHTQEQAAILKEIVKQGKYKIPLNNSLDFALRVKPSTSASGSQPSGNTKKDKIQQTPSSTQKNKVRSPTQDRKVFTKIGYTWRPTGQTFTIVGNACPLTRITTTAEVPLRKPTALGNCTPKPVLTLGFTSSKPRNLKLMSSKLFSGIWTGWSKHMIGDRSQLTIFVNKFFGTVKFKNDHVAKILGYGDYHIGNVMISRAYYVEGLGHNLFSVGQFCYSNLEVAFHQHTCFIRNLEGVDILTGSRGNNLYILSLGDMMASFPICHLSKASKTKSKDEAPDFIIKFLKMIQVRLKTPVRRIRTDNRTEFVNQTLREYYEKVRISHETSVDRSPQKNGVIERRNRMLIEAARTMLIYTKALLLLWAEAVATACYIQNRSIIRCRHGKTPYELLYDKLPDLSFFYVFGALCYPTNDSENLGKLQPKDDIGIFIGYAPTKKAF
ncbi:retrovirus-related pol polyprotein from transposon TNT 1-94, partial [Tanacetum coccineum]